MILATERLANRKSDRFRYNLCMNEDVDIFELPQDKKGGLLGRIKDNFAKQADLQRRIFCK